MAKKYCICGFANDYLNGVAPKTCKACKKEFAAAFYVPPEKIQTPRKTKSVKAVADEEEDEFEEESEEEIIVPDRSSIVVNVAKRVTIAGLRQGESAAGLSHDLPPAQY